MLQLKISNSKLLSCTVHDHYMIDMCVSPFTPHADKAGDSQYLVGVCKSHEIQKNKKCVSPLFSTFRLPCLVCDTQPQPQWFRLKT